MKNITLKNIEKSYGDTTVIKDLNLEIKAGERIIFLGPSGCGKSTILRMIAGLEPVTSGEVHLGKREVTHLPSGGRDVAMVFQNYALYPHMTVENNITYALKRNGISKPDRQERLNKVLGMLELDQYRKRMPKDLSGGQRQRVALARATVKKSDYFLLDEPLSNLDAKLRVRARRELLKLHKEFKQTFVYVTHDQVEAMALGDRIVVLNKGAVQMADTPENVYHHPRNIFVAKFIGSPPMNILSGIIRDSRFHYEDQNIDISEVSTISDDLNNTEVYLGIRPENMELATDEDYDIKGKVIFTENFSAEVAHTIKIADEEIVVMAPEVIDRKEIGIKFDRKHVHIFNKKTELNYKYMEK